MSGLLKYLEAEAEKSKAAANAVMAKSDEEGREISPDEKAEIDAHLETFKMYKGRAAAEKSKIEIREQLEAETGVADKVSAVNIEGDPGVPRTIGEAFTKSGAFRAIAQRKSKGGLGKSWTSEAVELDWLLMKAAASPVLESNNTVLFGSGANAGALTTLLGLETPGFVQVPPVIADLMTSIPVTVGNSVTYPVVAARTPVAYPGSGNQAEPVTEGAVKSVALYSFTDATDKLIKLAGYTKMSEEFLEDAPGLAAYINADLPLQIRLAEDAYLATVLYATAGAGTALGDNGFDAILGAITDIQNNGFTPTGMIISPTDWATLRIAKFTGGSEEYVGGGPFTPTNNPWNLRVVVTPRATHNSPIVGDFAQGAKIYRKGGLSVDATNTDQDDFVRNLVTIRAEERLVLGVTYPEAFKTADIS